jgi:hypothetical protein
MQAAYHGPGGKPAQPQPGEKKSGLGLAGKAGIIGGGALLGLGYLGLRAPQLRKKVLGQAIEAATETVPTKELEK